MIDELALIASDWVCAMLCMTASVNVALFPGRSISAILVLMVDAKVAVIA